jgi:hypothetical protein
MSKHFDHCNANGLVDGRIPVGKPCPFLAKCPMASERCPGFEGQLKPVAYSCAAARGFSICMEPKDPV